MNVVYRFSDFDKLEGVYLIPDDENDIPIVAINKNRPPTRQRFTVIHPFMDGNGRITRMFLNWMFKQKDLPPIYIKYDRKSRYFDALSIADKTGNYETLVEVFYEEIRYSLWKLNDFLY